MPNRRQIIDEARTWLGTPFQHQGRVKRVGVDCAGLLVGVARELGLEVRDYSGYGREPIPEIMGRVLRDNLELINIKDAQPGDVVWFRLDANPQHLAIITDRGIIHSSSSVKKGKERGRVVEQRLDAKWKSKIFRAFRFPGVVD